MSLPTYELAPRYFVTRLVRGGWQLAGGHGEIAREQALADLIAAFEAGVTTFDCADIYTGVEELYGEVRTRLGADGARMQVHTKLVPDLARLHDLKREDIAAIVERSLQRLRVEALDLVQFHWWDYAAPGWLEALGWLKELQQGGKVRRIGGTNFDTPRLRAILEAGIPLVSMQVQYSLLDRRPENGFADLCRERGVGLLCYGTVAGGFLSDRWLNQPEPQGALANRSLTKYKLIIDDFGGWDLFQELLRALRRVADRHGADIASVASRLTLDFPGVAATIVGATSRAHLDRNIAAVSLALSEEDRAEIDAVTKHAKALQGDVYALERDRHGRHGSIMKYNLNAE